MSSYYDQLKKHYPFLEPLDIYNFDVEDLDGLEAEDYKFFCDEYLMEESLENQSSKHDICKKLVRNFVHINPPSRKIDHYDCVCLINWLYNKAVSSNIPFDFVHGLFQYLGEQSSILPNFGSCDYDQFEIIMEDPEKIRKALIEYINECVKVYETYIGKCNTRKLDGIFCDELYHFEEIYKDIQTEFSESEYNIPDLRNAPGKNVEKFSLKVEEKVLNVRNGDVHADEEIAPGGMSTTNIATISSLVSVPIVSFYAYKFTPLRQWLRGIPGKKSRLSSDIGELTEQLQNDYEIEYLNSDDSQFHIGYHSANY
ncbi:hypothetical protein PVT01_120005400 [Plasmodium vivax]|uniref:VIR protein n=1 Tax=Plasmodium vivax TaxID=5855 RepID=A0A1G4H0K0_PLAVI|nr:hypothetical protein PVT01_120005400 [Plasmodium vivax]